MQLRWSSAHFVKQPLMCVHAGVCREEGRRLGAAGVAAGHGGGRGGSGDKRRRGRKSCGGDVRAAAGGGAGAEARAVHGRRQLHHRGARGPRARTRHGPRGRAAHAAPALRQLPPRLQGAARSIACLPSPVQAMGLPRSRFTCCVSAMLCLWARVG